MAWLQLIWKLEIVKSNEGGDGDEPSMQFAFVTIFNNIVKVHGHTTGHILNKIPNYSAIKGSVRSGRNVPDKDNPYIGFVARAVEFDNSGDENRKRDNENFYEHIRVIAQEVVDAEGLPTAAILWRAGNNVKLIDDLGNDDDRIGGLKNYPGAPTESVLLNIDGSTHIMWYYQDSLASFDLVFQEEDALYEFHGDLRIVTNEPPPSFP